MEETTTLTTEISSIQIKLLFLHFKSIKINDNIRRIESLNIEEKVSPERISAKHEIAYDIIDIFSLFEGYNSLVADVFNTSSVKSRLSKELIKELSEIK